MSTSSIHITGGLGFIGSNLVRHLNARGITPYIYDRLEGERWRNVAGLSFHLRSRGELLGNGSILDDTLIHLGADVDTTAPFSAELWENNVTFAVGAIQRFSRGRVVYASSAAVYGAEETDFTERLYGLKPLNAYAFTKLALDQTVFGDAPTTCVPKQCYGLRLFNVYGPNEGQKGEMASVVHKALAGQLTVYGDCDTESRWTLFKSHRAGVADGDQRRDFVHVDDVCSVILHFAREGGPPGLYNVGTGTARSFKELVTTIDPARHIDYRPMPEHLLAQYQYRTCADLTRLRAAGYDKPFLSLEEGVKRMT